jgi:hypothetical protein
MPKWAETMLIAEGTADIYLHYLRSRTQDILGITLRIVMKQ